MLLRDRLPAQLNLAALGYAPATLVTPLGCLTVVFNSIAASVFLGEPFLQRDILGIIFIFCGVVCVVGSQVKPRPLANEHARRAPSPRRTTTTTRASMCHSRLRCTCHLCPFAFRPVLRNQCLWPRP